jgi:hypothetical protein
MEGRHSVSWQQHIKHADRPKPRGEGQVIDAKCAAWYVLETLEAAKSE